MLKGSGWPKGLIKENSSIIAAKSIKILGHKVWCDGKTKETDTRLAAMSKRMKGVVNKGKVPWNKGLTKETSPILMRMAQDRTGRTKENNEGIAKAARTKTGRTKENDVGVANQAKKLTGRTKDEYEYLARSSAKQKGRTKETHPAIAIRAEKMKKYKGELSHCWIDGRSFVPYSKSFSKEIKRQIRLRDNYTCQRCGIKEGEYKQALDSHHIDYNKLNCRYDNLISLCNSCNGIVNGNRPYWEWYFKERLRIMEQVENITPNGQLKLCLIEGRE
jgi:hypothetical protein